MEFQAMADGHKKTSGSSQNLSWFEEFSQEILASNNL